jgi:glc operon protein GlcG
MDVTNQDLTNRVRTEIVVTTDTALELVRRGLAHGAARGVPVSVTVVDPGMGLVAFARGDGATPHSIETSRRKAGAAASKQRATGWMTGELALTLPLAAGNTLTNVRGGLPLFVDGTICGGLGVAGGTEDEDVEIAKATLVDAGFLEEVRR